MQPQEIWRPELHAHSQPVAWSWHGFLAPGLMTLLTSQWKSGKTTLVSLLLAQRAHGGTLAGGAVTAGATAVVSEESAALWDERCRRLGLPDDIAFFCRPFHRKPSMEQWHALLERVGRLHDERGVDLLVIDSLATMMPVRNENFAAAMIDALDPLRELTDRGLASLIVHHPKKGETIEGQAGRGSGAKDGFVDISIEMQRVRAPGGERRRRLTSFSRFAQTPPRLLIELSEDGTAYQAVEEVRDVDFAANWDYLRMVLEDEKCKATRDELLEHWPRDFPKPTAPTLWRWLDRAVEDQRVRRDGTGRRHQPFRYWLPHKEEQWAQDPLHKLLHPEPIEIEELLRLRRERGGAM